MPPAGRRQYPPFVGFHAPFTNSQTAVDATSAAQAGKRLPYDVGMTMGRRRPCACRQSGPYATNRVAKSDSALAREGPERGRAEAIYRRDAWRADRRSTPAIARGPLKISEESSATRDV